jgi:hypothetical protein
MLEIPASVASPASSLDDPARLAVPFIVALDGGGIGAAIKSNLVRDTVATECLFDL